MILLFLLFLSVLSIGTISAFFSVTGLLEIFPGIFWPIISMGIALEFSKLIGASFVYRYWHKSKLLTRTYLLGAVVILSVITSIGVYGYLSKNNISGNIILNDQQRKIDFIQKNIEIEEQNLVSERKTIEQMDMVLNNFLGDTSKIDRTEQVRRTQQRERQQAKTKIQDVNKALLSLQHQQDSLKGIQSLQDARVGPLKYLGELFGISSVEILKWFILLIVVVCDPLALAMVIALNIHRNECKRTVTNITMLPNDDIPKPIPHTEEPRKPKKNKKRPKPSKVEQTPESIGGRLDLRGEVWTLNDNIEQTTEIYLDHTKPEKFGQKEP